MTITITDEEMQELVREEMVNRICNDIERYWYDRENTYGGRTVDHIYKKELGDAIRKIFREEPKLVEDAVNRASEYLYQKGKSEIIKRVTESV